LIVHGADRREALARLSAALAEVEIAGPATNVVFLRRLAACRAFREADLDTGLIERSRDELFDAGGAIPSEALAAAVFAELGLEQDLECERARASGDPYSPWHQVDGWRLNLGSHHSFVFREGDARHEASVDFLDRGLRLRIAQREYAFAGDRLADGTLLLWLGDRAFKARAVRSGRDWHLFTDAGQFRLALEDELHGAELIDAGASLAAPMPGKVIAVLVKAGAKVEKGAPLLILEAMKMEHTITAPRDGEVKELFFGAGDQVSEGAELLKFEAAA
jgi:3-methylcrotonyl-CoA carboxylase alpha subunit